MALDGLEGQIRLEVEKYWDVEAVPSEKILKIESPNLSVIEGIQ